MPILSDIMARFMEILLYATCSRRRLSKMAEQGRKAFVDQRIRI